MRGYLKVCEAFVCPPQVQLPRAAFMVENARDLVVGSFELFTSRTAQRTNVSMRRLTFMTALLGVLAVSAGVLGINFDAPMFKAGNVGFGWTLGAMAVFLATARLVGRKRDRF